MSAAYLMSILAFSHSASYKGTQRTKETSSHGISHLTVVYLPAVLLTSIKERKKNTFVSLSEMVRLRLSIIWSDHLPVSVCPFVPQSTLFIKCLSFLFILFVWMFNSCFVPFSGRKLCVCAGLSFCLFTFVFIYLYQFVCLQCLFVQNVYMSVLSLYLSKAGRFVLKVKAYNLIPVFTLIFISMTVINTWALWRSFLYVQMCLVMSVIVCVCIVYLTL